MSFPDRALQISSAEQLKEILREAKRCVADGILREIRLPESPARLDNLASIEADGPWPDYIELYFENATGQRYKLVAETYHGSGGSWTRT